MKHLTTSLLIDRSDAPWQVLHKH